MNHTPEQETIAQELSLSVDKVENTIKLIDDGNTIPFIARYRKDVTGGMSDDILREFSAKLDYLRKLHARLDEIEASIEEQGKMTDEVMRNLTSCTTLKEAEIVYLPFKQKKKTRATVAKEKGLEPLSKLILDKVDDQEILSQAEAFIDPEKEVESLQSALAGAQDIVAETISEDMNLRKAIKDVLKSSSILKTSVTKDFSEEKTEFMGYYDYAEPISKIPGYRVLAVNRGEKKGVLSVKLVCPDDLTYKESRKGHTATEKEMNRSGLAVLDKKIQPQQCAILAETIEDAYKRLIFPSLEREIRAELKEMAEESAIKAFGINLKKLLLQYPVKGKTTMGFDPGFRNGCKIAVLDPMGTYIDSAIVFPPFTGRKDGEAEQKLLSMIQRDKVDVIALGNGTASRESEAFIADLIKKANREVSYVIVNEAGASIYSASKLAAEEYPELDVSIRGAISIAGRLQDPLSELIKIEPQHIGVGQYQHDVNQKALSKVLDEAVEDAVNSVGADINRASAVLLARISGITKSSASNIIDYREKNGAFKKKEELKKVRGIGEKAYEQCAGFTRVEDAEDVLDRTGIHPESYELARKLIKAFKMKNEDFIDHPKKTAQKLERVNIKKVCDYFGAGRHTVRDILEELKKPGYDPRMKHEPPKLKSDVRSIKDLKPGLELMGTVRNVVDFGAFVDIGVHQDGLVHISRMSKKYIKHPSDILSVGDVIKVTVVETDEARKRIGLSMIE